MYSRGENEVLASEAMAFAIMEWTADRDHSHPRLPADGLCDLVPRAQGDLRLTFSEGALDVVAKVPTNGNRLGSWLTRREVDDPFFARSHIVPNT
jgi:hypothetical protein